MRRSAFDEHRDQRIADEVGGSMKPCSECGTLAEHETLREYGARCGPCYGRYLRGDRQHSRLFTHAEKLQVLERLKVAVQQMAEPKHPRAWAHRLRDMEEAGAPLTRLQRETWRVALRDVPAEVDA